MAIRLGDAVLADSGRMDSDCEVAMAMAHCAMARDLEAGEEVHQPCLHNKASAPTQ